MKTLADKAKEVEAKFDEGQQIFRRKSVEILLARIQSLEIVAEQSVQRTTDKPEQLSAGEVVKNYNRGVNESFRRR